MSPDHRRLVTHDFPPMPSSFVGKHYAVRRGCATARYQRCAFSIHVTIGGDKPLVCVDAHYVKAQRPPPQSSASFQGAKPEPSLGGLERGGYRRPTATSLPKCDKSQGAWGIPQIALKIYSSKYLTQRMSGTPLRG